MRRRFPLGAGVFALALACAPGASSTGTSATTAESSTTTGDETTADGESSTGSTDDTTTDTTDGCTSGCDLAIPECDLFAQDCADGEKCVPWGSLTHCVEVVANANERGEPCQLTGPEDDCAAGLACWPDQPGGTEGECEQLCAGTFELPNCPDDADACAAYRRDGGWFPLCRPKCDPTLGACGPDSVCEQSSYLDWFVCAPAALPTTDVPRDYCDLDAAPKPLCAADLHCDRGPFGCVEGCCYAYCDLKAADTCEFGACLPLTNPAPGFDALGACKNG